MTFPSEQQHFDAVLAALAAANARPYDYDDKPSETSYSLVSVGDRFGGVMRVTGRTGTRSVRVTVRAVAKTPDAAREIRRRADTALREQRVTVGGYISTPIQFETAEPVGPDGDAAISGSWFSALSSYTYTV